MTTATPLFGSVGTLTITLTGLASDTNLIAGRQSTAIDQKDTDDAIDALVGGLTTTGTSPTASRQIEVWTFGSYDDATFSAGAGASDANFSPTGEKTLMRLLTVIPTDGTTSHLYEWGPYSQAEAYGGVIPVQWGVYEVHNTGQNLNATAANHEVQYFPIKFESA
jgi:hypothetical protein